MDIKEKNSFIMYTDYLKHVQKLEMKQRGELLTAILMYASTGEIPELDSNTDMLFGMIQDNMDRDHAAYMEKVEKRRDAGRQGGRPKKASGYSENKEKSKKANGFFEKQNNPDNENDNENDNKKTLCKADADALFERLWNLYPLKRGKGAVSDANKRRLLDIGFEEMTRAIDRYKADLAKESWKHPKNGSTFFNSGYIDYLDENYVPLEVEVHKSNQISSKFNNFQQREYDYAELEKRLLNSDPVHMNMQESFAENQATGEAL